jgi:hypothetical protein
MPAAVPLPLRQRLWRLAQQGLPAAALAGRLALPLRTARPLLHRSRRNPDSPGPSYRPGPGRPRWAASPLTLQLAGPKRKRS